MEIPPEPISIPAIPDTADNPAPKARRWIAALLIAVGAAVVAGAFWVFPRNPHGTSESSPTPSTSPVATTKTFRWLGVSFAYPSDWTAKILTYQSPGQMASGAKPDEVGFTIFKTGYENDASGQWLITAGGPQSAGQTCSDVHATACAIYRDDVGLSFPYFTNSTDHETLTLFAEIRHQIIPPGAQYQNTDYGFVVDLPASWKGFTVSTQELPIWDIASSQRIGTYPEITLHSPLATEEDPRQGIPIMVFTLDQWDHIVSEEYNVSAAPFLPGDLARNSQYVFALPPRYNYSFSTGWEEVEQIIRTRPVLGLEK